MSSTKNPFALRRAVLAPLCLLCLSAAPSRAQLAPAAAPTDQAQPAAAAATTPANASALAASEIVRLSPFEVRAQTIGYFQSNAISGTRLNAPIEDLGQSITVMTKEQMQDFAMLDINDVFD
jgi:outer membrane receptor for ferric coprogen and ferric-rhodotorulic acid